LVTTITFVSLCGLSVPASGQDSSLRNKYRDIEVVAFDVKDGVTFPANYLSTLTEELVSQLVGVKKFGRVVRGAEPPADLDLAIRVTGTITEFKAGSRAKRYFVGFGAGQTKITAHVRFLDRATNAVLFEDDVDGRVAMGGFGGESIGATRGLAKELAKVAKKVFF